MKIVEIPLVNGLNRTKGTEEAPEKILKCLNGVESEKVEFGKMDLIEINDLIYKKAFESFDKKVLFLGGDHSISYSLTRAFFNYSEHNGKEPCLIIFDAHPDLMKPVDSKIPTHEEWLRALIEYGFPVKNILLVGVRKVDPVEKKFMGEKIRKVSIEELMFDLEAKTDAIMEFGYGKNVYVSIDIDCVDPAYAPGTGYCEPGGLSSKEFLYIIKRLSKMKNLRAVDLVEINPSKDEGNRTIELGGKIVELFLN
jgi:agmatinase